MRKLKLLIILSVLALSLVGCSKVPAGNVGVKVYLLGTNKGVDHEELSVGRYWIGLNEELYLFPTFQQNYVWTATKTEGSENDESITFQTKEGMSCNADIGISYHLDPEKISVIFQKYRKGIDEITDVFVRNIVRDAINKVASTMSVQDVYGVGKQKFVADVTELSKSQLDSNGIMIDKLSLIGEIRIPQTVKAALNQKVQATQRAQQRENELREAEAQAKKAEAEARGKAQANIARAEGEARAITIEAEAQAKANTLLAKSITSNLVKYKQIEKWDGKLPTVTSDGGTLVNLK